MPDLRIHPKFSLSNTILVLAIVCVLLAWRVDRNLGRPSYYLHVIVSAHDLQYDFDPELQQRERYEYNEIFTVTLVPDKPFYFGCGRTALPGREIMLEGVIAASGDEIHGKFYFQMDNPDDPNQTIQYNNDGEIELDALNRMWEGRRYFIISESNDSSHIYESVRSAVESAMEKSFDSRTNNTMHPKPSRHIRLALNALLDFDAF